MTHNDTDGNDSDGVECPTCGDSFKSERGVSVHHKNTHGESIAGFKYECEICGTTVTRHQRKDSDQTICCSQECVGELNKRERSGENHPLWREGVTLECEICGDKFTVKESAAENRRTCSQECGGKLQTLERCGKNNPAWKGGKVEIECEICGDLFSVTPAVSDDRVTCSKKCYKEFKAQEWNGEGNPNYKEPVTKECVVCGVEYECSPSLAPLRKTCGSDECYRQNMKEVNSGSTHPCWNGGYDEYYGPNWETQREKARERDNQTCQGCGVAESEYWRELDVHHIKRKEWFVENCGDEWWEEANKLDNLVTLCISCHKRWEGMPIRPTLMKND